jgi:hypothetical protein
LASKTRRSIPRRPLAPGPLSRRQTALALAAVLLAASAAPPAFAQDDPPPPPPLPPRGTKPPPTERVEEFVDPASPTFRGAALGDLSESREVDGERVIWAVGGVAQPVWIRRPDFEIRCENAVLWGDRVRLQTALESRQDPAAADPGDFLGKVLYAIYAEGDVFVRRDKYVLRAKRVLLDFQRNQAYLVDARVEAETKAPSGNSVPLSVRAAIVRGTARDAFRAEDATVAACTYERPHLAFTTSWVEVDLSGKEPRYETGWWPTVRADTVVGHEVPLLPLPKLGGSLGGRPVQAFQFSRSDRFGTTLGVGFGGKLEREDGSTWGTWQTMPRWRSDRGAGVEVEFDHESRPDAAGRVADKFQIDAEYQHDTADQDEFSERAFDGLPDGTTQEDRGLAKLFWRHRFGTSDTDFLGRGWRLDTRAEYVSDRGYLPEYHAADALHAPALESYLHLRRTWDDQGLSVLGSYRLSDEANALVRRPQDAVDTNYAVQTEYLPSATWHLVNRPLLSPDDRRIPPLNLSVEASVANVERRFDEFTADQLAAASGWKSENVLRENLSGRLTAPFELGIVQITPAAGGSIYHVSDANGFANAGTPEADDDEGRSSAFVGLRAGAEASRLWRDASSSAFDLHGLRHVASLDVQWFDRFSVSDEDPNQFQVNDLQDELHEQNVISTRLRNRFQTKREGEVVNWIDYEARFLWYAQESDAQEPSLLGLREDFAAPLERLDFPAAEKYSAARREGSAFHQHRARMQVRPDLWVEGEADYDMTASRLETSGAGVRWFPDRRFSMYVGRRTISGDSAVWTFRGDWVFTGKWGLSGEFQTDTKGNESLSTTVGLFRRSHDFTMAIEFESDGQLDETGVSFVLYPHDWIVRKDDPFSRRRPLDFDALRWYR